MILYNCTLYGNTAGPGGGGGIWVRGGTLTLGNSIVALNGSDINGTINSEGFNLFSETSNLTVTGITTGNQVASDPGLDSYGLNYNGGPTPTIRLVPGSVAIDAGKTFGGFTTDQRGILRPTNILSVANVAGGDGSDIGAYEIGPPGPVISVQPPNAADFISGSSSASFGTVNLGVTGDLTFTITNRGEGTLALTGTPAVVLGGPDAADFTVTAVPAGPLKAGAATAFTIHFAPTTPGSKSASVSIASTDTTHSSFTFGLTANVPDLVTLSPSLTAPASGSYTSSPVTVTYHLPEAGLAGSVKLGFGNFSAFLPAGSETAGDHTVTFDAKGNNLADGTYTVSISYQDATGNTAASASNTNVHLDTIAPIIDGTFSPLTVFAGTPLPDYTTQATSETGATVTQSPLAHSSTTVGVTDVIVTAKDAAGNQSTATVHVNVRPVGAVTSASLTTFGAKAGAPGAGAAGGPPAGAKLTSLGVPAIDDDGTLAFSARWASAPHVGGSGLFTSSACIAEIGAAVPGLSPATYRFLTDPVLRGGGVAFIALLGGVAPAKEWAVLSGPPSAPVVVAQSGVVTPDGNGQPLASGAVFHSFKAVEVRGASLALMAQLAGGTGAGRVNAGDDFGIWMKDATHSLRLVLREGQSVGGHAIGTLVAFGVGNGSPGQGRGWLTQPAAAGPKALALATFAGTRLEAILSVDIGGTVTVLSQTGPGGAGGPNVTGGSFASYSYPAADDLGDSAFLGSLTVSPQAATAANARGIFAHFAGGNGALYDPVARVGTAAGVDGANFSALGDPMLAADGGLAFPALLGGGTARGLASSTLWWKPFGASKTLIAQGGQRPGLDLPAAARWRAFTSLAIAPNRGPIFAGTLVVGPGGVTVAKAYGVWATDFTGAPRLLFRTGDQVEGKTLKAFTLLNATAGSLGVTRSFNNQEQVAWRATFTDNTQAIVTTEIP